MNPTNAICIVVDGLRASALGAYGNTWYPTPALDQLAARSIVADWLLVDSPIREHFYRGLWGGRSAWRSVSAGDPESESLFIPHWLAESGVRQTVLTDEPWLAQQADGRSFQSCRQVDHCNPNGNDSLTTAESIEETALARLFAALVEELDEWASAGESDAEGARMLWVHSCGMLGPWDAPQDIRQSLAEEGETAATALVVPPQYEKGDDPDRWLEWRIAYAAQATVLDACIGAVVAALDETGLADDTMLMLVGSRGFALGEHGTAGAGACDLFEEVLHVPWLVRVPEGRAADEAGWGSRFDGLCQPADVAGTLLDWFGIDPGPGTSDGMSLLTEAMSPLGRQYVISCGEQGQRAIRIPAWMLRHTPEGDPPAHLYVKPDDRWEMNDVAPRCPEVTDKLLEVLAEVQRRSAGDGPYEPMELDAELLQSPS